jgi:hypothetical protein
MSRCTSCSAELQPNWKFCIHCGTAVLAAIPVVAPAVGPPVVEPHARLTPLGLFGWGLGVLLAVIGIVAAVLLSTP